MNIDIAINKKSCNINEAKNIKSDNITESIREKPKSADAMLKK